MTEQRKTYDMQQSMVKEQEKQIDDLRNPLGKRPVGSMYDFGPGEIVQEIGNTLLSIPELPRIKWLELRAKLGKKRLSRMYERSHAEALKLNEKHNELLQRAVEAEDQLRYFEVHELGMSEEELSAPQE